MERWDAAIQDYEVLMRENPDDEEVNRAMFEAQVQLKEQRGEDVRNMTYTSRPKVVQISSPKRFKDFATSPGSYLYFIPC